MVICMLAADEPAPLTDSIFHNIPQDFSIATRRSGTRRR